MAFDTADSCKTACKTEGDQTEVSFEENSHWYHWNFRANSNHSISRLQRLQSIKYLVQNKDIVAAPRRYRASCKSRAAPGTGTPKAVAPNSETY